MCARCREESKFTGSISCRSSCAYCLDYRLLRGAQRISSFRIPVHKTMFLDIRASQPHIFHNRAGNIQCMRLRADHGIRRTENSIFRDHRHFRLIIFLHQCHIILYLCRFIVSLFHCIIVKSLPRLFRSAAAGRRPGIGMNGQPVIENVMPFFVHLIYKVLCLVAGINMDFLL